MRQKFLKYVFRSSIGMIGISIYLLADTFFISLSAGADGLTVLNLTLPLYGLIFAIGAMIGIGAATRYTIHRQQGKDSSRYFTEALLWQVICALPFMLIGLLAPQGYLRLMGGDEGIVALGTPYARIVFIGAPLFMANYTFTAFARNDHATGKAMVATLSGSFFNIVFDYLLMFPLKMGLVGAAAATALSPLVTILVTLTHYLGPECHIEIHRPHLSPRVLLLFSQLGFSAFIGEISSAITTTVFNFLLLRAVGNVGVAAYGVIANLSLVAVALFNGIAQGVQPLLSKAYGRGEQGHVRKLLQYGMITAACAEGLILLISRVFNERLVAVFNSEANAQLAVYAQRGMKLYFLGFLLAGINILMVNYFSAVGKARKAFLSSILRGVIAIVICAAGMSVLFGIDGIWLSFLASEAVTFAAVLIMTVKSRDDRDPEL